MSATEPALAVDRLQPSASLRYADTARDRLRDHILDAVGDQLRERSWGELTMAAVGDAAGVSRQTVYNAFGSRSELAEAYVIREAERFLGAVEAAVRASAPDARDALAAALEIFLTAAETHPLVRAITSSGGGEELLPLVTTRGQPVVETVTRRLSALLRGTWPTLPTASARLVADTLVRLAISHAALPAGSPRATAEAIADLLTPAFDVLLGNAGAGGGAAGKGSAQA